MAQIFKLHSSHNFWGELLILEMLFPQSDKKLKASILQVTTRLGLNIFCGEVLFTSLHQSI